MRAVALTAVLAAFLCALLADRGAAAQDPPGLTERLGLEGPLDNDTARPCNDVATRALATIERGARTDEALEAARRALVASSPGDAVCIDPRRSLGIELAVRRAIADPAAFAARFEDLARAALDEAGNVEAALERVEHENPFTRSAVIASLRRFDLFFERGDYAAAGAALERARTSAAIFQDPALGPGISTRSESLRRVVQSAGGSGPAVLGPGIRLRLTATIELDPQGSDDPAWRLAPSGAFDPRASLWIQSGENLVEIDPQSKARSFAPQELCAALGATWLPAFGDADVPWLQRPAVGAVETGAGAERSRGPELALVLGRAKETRGNALCVFDLAESGPRPIWIHAERGFAHADGMRAEQAEVLLEGRLEFQPGPVFCAGLVIAQVLQWHQPLVSPSEQSVEAAKTSAWLVAFDARSGSVAWKRRIATGADRRARTASRFAGERGLSCISPPLALFDREVLVATELGVFARHSALDGELVTSWKLRRKRPPPDARAGFGGPFAMPIHRGGAVTGCSFAVACADSGGIVYYDEELDADIEDAEPEPDFERIEGLERLVAAKHGRMVALVRSQDRLMLQAVDARTGYRRHSVPLPRGAAWQGSVDQAGGILCAFEGRVALFDPLADLALVARIDLPGLASEGECGLLVHGSKAYVIGTRRAWVLALE